jgi:hypothetical protein
MNAVSLYYFAGQSRFACAGETVELAVATPQWSRFQSHTTCHALLPFKFDVLRTSKLAVLHKYDLNSFIMRIGGRDRL